MVKLARPPIASRMAKFLRQTPFHPQWLMPARQVNASLRGCQGVVLDIGSAEGWLAQWLHPDARYVSIDYPTTATGLYGTRPMVFADASHLPFSDETIDAVGCYEVAEHVRQPNELFKEVYRVLRTGGYAEFTTPFLYPVHDAPFDYQRWTRHGWERILQDAGLQLHSIEPRGTALHCVSVLACLGIAGPLANLRGPKAWFFLALAAFLILVINLSGYLLSFVWPKWSAMTVGYRVLASKRVAGDLT